MTCYGYINPWAYTDDRCGNCKNSPAGHGWRGHINWPTESHDIHPDRGFRKGHPAIDIDTAIGSPVYAAETGVVIWAGYSYYGYGNLIILDHGGGYQTLYAHLEDVEIACNTSVTRGQHIGNVGVTGNSSFPHLHFEVRENGLSCNPLIWLEGTPDNGGNGGPTMLYEDFESEEWTHNCKVFPVGADPYSTEVGSIFVPKDWTFWFKHDPGTYDQPEGRYCWASADPARVHTGNGAYMFFSFYRKHLAGLMRQVSVTPGTYVKLTAWAHGWSNHLLEGHEDCYDNPKCSCGVGDEPTFILDGEAPPLNGNSWNDGIQNMLFIVGIDPTGGTDPFADTVEWGHAAYIYNVYHEIPEVIVKAQSSVVTIFLCNSTMWAYKHNDTYWDTIKLEEVEEVEECKGTPRIQYARTYLLMHPEADETWVKMVAEVAWDARRYTIGGSADDAGIGDLDHKRAIIIRPEDWPGGEDGIREFFEEYYPGTDLVMMPGNMASVRSQLEVLVENDNYPFEPSPPDDLLLCQCDPEWRNDSLGGSSCSSTLCQLGCFVSNLAMVQRYYHIKLDATPRTANEALKAVNGFSGCDTLWSALPAALGLQITGKTGAHEALDAGYCCMAEVQPASLQHFVLITKREGTRYWMYDPWKCKVGWLDETYAGVESWRIIKPAEEQYDQLNLVDPHLQTVETGILAANQASKWPSLVQKLLSLYFTKTYEWKQAKVRAETFKYVRDAKPNYVKVFSFEDVYGVMRAYPDALIGVRHCTNDYNDIFIEDTALGAKRWVDIVRDALYRTCDHVAQEFPNMKKPYFYFEGPNELYPSLNAEKVRRAANLDRDIVLEVERTELPIKVIGYCAGVGNPHESEHELLLPLAREIQRTGGAMGLHLYWWGNQNVSGLESWWPYHAGRYQRVDEFFVQNGIHVDWLCGEAGVVQSENGYQLNPGSGWKDIYTWDRYLQEILTVNEWDNLWNSTHGGRFKGRAYFTTCAEFCNWLSFRLLEAQWKAIAAALKGTLIWHLPMKFYKNV